MSYRRKNYVMRLLGHSTYERVTLAGDFNAQVGEKLFSSVLYQHKLSFQK